MVTVTLRVLLEEGERERAWNAFSACSPQSNKTGHYVTEQLIIHQLLQEPTYQLSKEPGTDNLHLFCFLLLLQKKSMHPTLITSRKRQKRENPAPQRARLGRKTEVFNFRGNLLRCQFISPFPCLPPPYAKLNRGNLNREEERNMKGQFS